MYFSHKSQCKFHIQSKKQIVSTYEINPQRRQNYRFEKSLS